MNGAHLLMAHRDSSGLMSGQPAVTQNSLRRIAFSGLRVSAIIVDLDKMVWELRSAERSNQFAYIPQGI
jgi:hypothetical protein